MYDKIHGARGEAKIGSKADDAEDMENEDDDNDGLGKSEAAVRKSVLSVAAGDRIFEAIDLADSETQEILATNSTNRARKARGEVRGCEERCEERSDVPESRQFSFVLRPL